jgi:hypothetical protein
MIDKKITLGTLYDMEHHNETLYNTQTPAKQRHPIPINTHSPISSAALASVYRPLNHNCVGQRIERTIDQVEISGTFSFRCFFFL